MLQRKLLCDLLGFMRAHTTALWEMLAFSKEDEYVSELFADKVAFRCLAFSGNTVPLFLLVLRQNYVGTLFGLILL